MSAYVLHNHPEKKARPYKWIRRQRSRGKTGLRREEFLRALAMLPKGSGAETVHIKCKHLIRKHKCVSILTTSNKELKIILQIIFLLCIHTCVHEWIHMYMKATSSGWVASSFLSTFSVVETGRLSRGTWISMTWKPRRCSCRYIPVLQLYVTCRPRTSCMLSHAPPSH